MQRAGKPLILLCAVTATSGIFSAFLVNDAICLVLAPLVLELTLRMGRKPVPYLLAVAMDQTLDRPPRSPATPRTS
jgi:Na+/H+ antiporter NhaD/arsenite permease-like protein